MNGTVVSIVIFGLSQVIAVIGAYYGMKGNIAELGSTMKLLILQEQKDRQSEHMLLKEMITSAIVKHESALSDALHRLTTLETGQDEWTKALRQRTHDLANQLNVFAIKIDRLEHGRAQAQEPPA